MTANVTTFRSRSAFREVGKVFGFDKKTAGRPAGLASSWEWKGPTDTMENTVKAAGFDLKNLRTKKFLGMAERKQNLPPNPSHNSAGLGICKAHLDPVVPFERPSMTGR